MKKHPAEFRENTKATLAKRAGYLCSNPHCGKPTVGGHHDENRSTLIGEAAHIKGGKMGSARYDSLMTDEERRSITNGVWLCSNCATLIDKDELTYPKELLHEWKKTADKESSLKVRGNKDNSSNSKTKKELTLTERAALNKSIQEKKLKVDQFLQNPAAIEEARNQVKKLIAKLNEVKETIQTPQFIIGFEKRADEMYAIGTHPGNKYLCFNWTPHNWDLNSAPLWTIVYTIEGLSGFDRNDKVHKKHKYKYSRNPEGQDGWVDFETGKNFVTTQDLADQWIEDFLQFIDYK